MGRLAVDSLTPLAELLRAEIRAVVGGMSSTFKSINGSLRPEGGNGIKRSGALAGGCLIPKGRSSSLLTSLWSPLFSSHVSSAPPGNLSLIFPNFYFEEQFTLRFPYSHPYPSAGMRPGEPNPFKSWGWIINLVKFYFPCYAKKLQP